MAVSTINQDITIIELKLSDCSLFAEYHNNFVIPEDTSENYYEIELYRFRTEQQTFKNPSIGVQFVLTGRSEKK